MVDELAVGLPAARTVAINTGDGHDFELIYQPAAGTAHCALYWLSAMGVPARHYQPLASHLATQGIAVFLHEWRGLGSSSLRAGRRQDWGYRQLLEQDIATGLAAASDAEPGLPLILGGHSLGGQLSVIYASLHPQQVQALLLVATGAPYWRNFRRRFGVRLLYQLAAPIARLRGHFPGRRLGFAGNEARGVIADWARSGREGKYRQPDNGQLLSGLTEQLEQPLLALVLDEDWLAPAASLAHMLAPMTRADGRIRSMNANDLGLAHADHFSWMKQPQAIASTVAEWAQQRFNGIAGGKLHTHP